MPRPHPQPGIGAGIEHGAPHKAAGLRPRSVRTAAGLVLGALAAAGVSVAAAATIAVKVLTADGKALPDTIVMLHALDAPSRPSPPVAAVMDQINLAFAPDLLVIPVGSTVSFPNTDTTSHQIYSFSPTHRFQLPLYRGKPYPPEHFDKAGLVTLGCNIHDNMVAYILVTDAPLFGRTDATGTWAASALARGRYRVELWHPRLREDAAALAREVSIGDERAELSIRLAKSLRPPPLAGRPHSWDAY